MVSKVKKQKLTKKSNRNSRVKNILSTDQELKNDFPEITGKELNKLKRDESYREGFLLAVRLVASELKNLIDKN